METIDNSRLSWILFGPFSRMRLLNENTFATRLIQPHACNDLHQPLSWDIQRLQVYLSFTENVEVRDETEVGIKTMRKQHGFLIIYSPFPPGNIFPSI